MAKKNIKSAPQTRYVLSWKLFLIGLVVVAVFAYLLYARTKPPQSYIYVTADTTNVKCHSMTIAFKDVKGKSYSFVDKLDPPLSNKCTGDHYLNGTTIDIAYNPLDPTHNVKVDPGTSVTNGVFTFIFGFIILGLFKIYKVRI